MNASFRRTLARIAGGVIAASIALVPHSSLAAKPAPPARGPASGHDTSLHAVVLVSIDGARAGFDAWPEAAPSLAAMAARGARFEWATTPTPLALPATAALLTGLTPAHNGLRSEALGAVGDKVPTLASRFARGGFATLALPADHLAHARTGLGHGFTTYQRDSAVWPDTARVDSALTFVADNDRSFVWLGFSMGEPGEVWRRYFGAGLDTAQYTRRAHEIDLSLARLVRGLSKNRRFPQTLIVIAGTNGMAVPGWPLVRPVFDGPSLPGCGLDLSEAVLRVPLVFTGPLVTAHRGTAALPADWTSTLDVAPTVLEAAGLPPGPGDGVSLWPVLAGKPLAPRVLVHETDADRVMGWRPRRSARIGTLEMMSYGSLALTLHGNEPGFAPAPGDAEQKLATALSAFTAALKTKPDAATAGNAARVRDGENAIALELIRTLPARGGPTDSLAIKNLYELSQSHPENLLLRLESTVSGSLGGSDDPAAALFLDTMKHHPEFPEATLAYGDHLLRHNHAQLVPDQMLKLPQGSSFEIEGLWREVIARTARLQFAEAISALDRAPEFCAPPGRVFRDSRTALPQLEKLRAQVQADPDSAGLRLAYGKALGEFGLVVAAYQQLNQARVINVGDPEPNLIMGDYLTAEGKHEAARNAYARAVEADRDNVRGLIGVADSWLAEGRRREALPSLERAAEAAPNDSRIRYNLACVLASVGEVDRAATELERAVQLGYSDWEQMATDEDLVKVRDTDTYRRLLAKAPAPSPH